MENSELSATCSFTGYRPQKLPSAGRKDSTEYRKLYNLIKEEIISLSGKGVKYFQSGMALGTDMMCAEAVLELKKDLDIHLFCALPCINQCDRWNENDKNRYREILKSCSGYHYVSECDYFDGCMQKRNRWLIDTAQYVLAVFDGKSGGTMSTVNYAKKKQRTIIVLDPFDYTRVELLHKNYKGVLYV